MSARRSAFLVTSLALLSAPAWVAGATPNTPTPPAAAILVRGAQLAALGNCAGCHTREGGKPYAGGRAIETPFGTIYGTNITPDPDTGIGKWSQMEFMRAMREGVDRAGRQLYPAFPYDHYTRLSSEDDEALYAFLMSREPVKADTPHNHLRFPANVRPLVAFWKVLFLDKQRIEPDPAQSREWNRGAYLVEALGHCGACHTPRNRLGAEIKQRSLKGGEAEGWDAPALDFTSSAPAPWSAAQIFNYLRYGGDRYHGTAAGPMAEIVGDLSRVPEEDVRAIAAYVAATANQTGVDASQKTADALSFARRREYDVVPRVDGRDQNTAGAVIFAGACASCHHSGGTTPYIKPVELGLSNFVAAPTPRNLIRIILDGLTPSPGAKGALMPGFAGALTEAQVTALVDYLRAHFSNQPAWPEVPQQVHEIMRRAAG